MSNQNEYKFIDGDFAAEQAKTLLFSLINYKIDFHSLDSFSDYVRFNGDSEKSKKRISELTIMRDELLKVIDAAEKNGAKLNIKSTIAVSLIEE